MALVNRLGERRPRDRAPLPLAVERNGPDRRCEPRREMLEGEPPRAQQGNWSKPYDGT